MMLVLYLAFTVTQYLIQSGYISEWVLSSIIELTLINLMIYFGNGLIVNGFI